MESFHWDAHFETGLTDVDAQHRQLVNLINGFGDLLGGPDAALQAGLAHTIEQLVAYSHQHFGDEEALMLASGVDARHQTEHLAAHREFFAAVAEMLAGQGDGRAARPDNILKFLVHWLACHILGMDQALARQIHAIRQGTPADVAYAPHSDVADGAIGPMLRALNGLFHEVSLRNRELMELNRTLEARIEERTRSLALANEQLAAIALTDALTGLPNRRHCLHTLAALWEESAATGKPLAVMMVDADGFKQVNDTCGHDAGDRVLRELARALRYSVRTDDVVCRLGGDEFIVICPATATAGAVQVAETLRRTVAALQVRLEDGAWQGSVSVGVAARAPAMAGHEELIKAADNAVYAAKKRGRNCVVAA